MRIHHNMKALISALLPLLASVICPRQYSSTYQAYSKLKPATFSITHNHRFKSQNGRLDIVSSSGKVVRFNNTATNINETDRKTYNYLGESDLINGFFVHEMGYELGSIIMITKSGEKVSVWDIPYVSPHGKLAVSLSQSVESNLIPNGIQVLRIESGEVINKCDIPVSAIEPQDLRWIDDKSFIVKFQYFTEDGDKVNRFSYKVYTVK